LGAALMGADLSRAGPAGLPGHHLTVVYLLFPSGHIAVGHPKLQAPQSCGHADISVGLAKHFLSNQGVSCVSKPRNAP
jgi:hypothetical protein